MALSDDAYNYMKKKILSLEWYPDQSVLEQDVADAIEISRTPVRAAFNQLIEEGYLVRKVNKGVYVSHNFMSKDDFKERLETIEVLINHSLQRLETADFEFPTEVLYEALQAMERKITDEYVEFVEIELDFWNHILSTFDNSYTRSIIRLTFDESFHQSDYIGRVLSGSRKEVLTHLTTLTSHLERGDYVKARREVRILFNQLIVNVYQGSKDMRI